MELQQYIDLTHIFHQATVRMITHMNLHYGMCSALEHGIKEVLPESTYTYDQLYELAFKELRKAAGEDYKPEGKHWYPCDVEGKKLRVELLRSIHKQMYFGMMYHVNIIENESN